MHIQLTAQASTELVKYLNQDLEGRNPSRVDDLFFLLQQCVLDGLLTGIQIEIASLS